MPELSRFYGIVIAMYFNDHGPPHFHARYAGAKAKVAIDPVQVVAGQLPPRAMKLVVEWAQLHQAELLHCWALVMQSQVPPAIPPLD